MAGFKTTKAVRFQIGQTAFSAALFVCAQITCLAAPPVEGISPVLETKAIDWPIDAEALLSVEPTAVTAGTSFKIACEINCTGGAGELFNPFVWEGYKLPAQIVITSSDGSIRRAVLAVSTEQGDKPARWMSIASGQSVGRTFTITLVQKSGSKPNDSRFVDLPPGAYNVQAIYSHWLFGLRPSSVRPPKSSTTSENDEPQPFTSWSPERMDEPAVVSKPVKLIVESGETSSKPKVAKNALHAELRPNTIRAIYGRHAEVEVRMSNESDKLIEVYDPRLNGLLWGQRAVVLAVLDADGNFVGDILLRSHGSSISPRKSDWIRMPAGGTVATKVRFMAGKVPSVELGVPNDLPPGKYQVELRVHNHIISGRPNLSSIEAALRKAAARALGSDLSQLQLPNDDGDAKPRQPYDEWQRTLPGEEICRSNRIELHILPRTGD